MNTKKMGKSNDSYGVGTLKRAAFLPIFPLRATDTDRNRAFPNVREFFFYFDSRLNTAADFFLTQFTTKTVHRSASAWIDSSSRNISSFAVKSETEKSSPKLPSCV